MGQVEKVVFPRYAQSISGTRLPAPRPGAFRANPQAGASPLPGLGQDLRPLPSGWPSGNRTDGTSTGWSIRRSSDSAPFERP